MALVKISTHCILIHSYPERNVMSGSHYLIYKELARESIIKKKNGKFP